MTDDKRQAPERITCFPNSDELGWSDDVACNGGFFRGSKYGPYDPESPHEGIEYVRADLHDALRAEREALAFYADPETWADTGPVDYYSPARDDEGAIARAALKDT